MTVVVNNETQTIITTPGGLASLVIPPGSQITSISLDVVTSPTATGATTDEALTAVLDFLESSELTATGAGTEVGYIFTIDFRGSASNPFGAQLVMNGASIGLLRAELEVLQVGATESAVPIAATLNVLPETLAQVGGDLSRLSVVYVDSATGAVEPVTMLPSPAPGVLAFEFTKAGSYAVLVRAVAAASAVPIPADTGTGIGETSDKTSAYLALAGVLAAIAVTSLGARAALRRTQG